MPTVSVVLATYGRPPYLAQAIESVLAQSVDDFELLVSDDSAGAAAEIVEAASDPRLRYHVNERTLGAADNHWAAFGRTTAPYIAIINRALRAVRTPNRLISRCRQGVDRSPPHKPSVMREWTVISQEAALIHDRRRRIRARQRDLDALGL